jgi:methylmalonyl-CoA mutase
MREGGDVEHLLEEFPPVSTAEWEAAIARDLKGADYEKRLIWRSEEGLAVKPYYRAEDLKDLAYMDAAPGAFPLPARRAHDRRLADSRRD